MLNYTQYPEAKTNKYSIRNNTQYPEPKTQNPIPPQYLVYQIPNATRDTLRDNTQHQIHQVQTKINLKLYSVPPLGSPVSNPMTHYQCGPKNKNWLSVPIVLVMDQLYVPNMLSVDLVLRKL